MTGNKDKRLVLSHRIVFCIVITAVILLSIAAGLLTRDQVIAQTMARGKGQTGSNKGMAIGQGHARGGVKGGVAGGVPGGVQGGVEAQEFALPRAGITEELESLSQVPPSPPAPPSPSEPSTPPEPRPPSAQSPVSPAEAPRSRGAAPVETVEPVKPSARPSGLSPLAVPAPVTGAPGFALRPSASPVAPMKPTGPMGIQKDEKEKPDSSVIKKVTPKYPDSAKEAKVTGEVEVEVVIDEKGDVVKAKAVSGPGPLRSAAVEAAKGWKFKPVKISSKPVKVIATLTFDFQL